MPPPQTHVTHTGTDTTRARAAPQTHTPRKNTPPNPRETATASTDGPQPGVAENRNQARTQEGQATTHHRRQWTPARSDREPHPGPSARSGEEHPPPPAAKPSQEWRENALRNLRQEWLGTTHNTHQPGSHQHHQQAPAGKTNRHTPHTHQHTQKALQRPHHHHKHTTYTPACAARQTHTARETPHPTPRKRPPLQPADPSQEWRGTSPRTLSQEWRGASHHQHQRTPQPGLAGDRTQRPQPGVARERPPRTLSRKRGTRPGKPTDLSQEWRRSIPQPTPEDPSQEWRGATPKTLRQEW